jgi:hypothetical protein
MLSLYGKYVKECVDWEIIEDEFSFVTYQKLEDEIRIIDMFVSPEKRNNSIWNELYNKVEKVAQLLNCGKISAVINKQIPINNQKRTIHICKKVGMSSSYEDEFFIIYSRGLK